MRIQRGSLNSLISAIRVEGLFGLYTYRLPGEGELSDAAILYGENGVGKSTLLRLSFHLLSGAGDRGHRGALYNAQFNRLEIDLANGTTLVAAKNDPNYPKLVNLWITRGEKPLAWWPYLPREERQSAEEQYYYDPTEGLRIIRTKKMPERLALFDKSVPYGEEAYLKALREQVPMVFILHAERRLDSDSVSDPNDEIELRRLLRLDEPKRISDLVVRSRSIALSQALAAAARWVQSKAVQGANQGSMNVHSVYKNVLEHLMTPRPVRADAVPDSALPSLIGRLREIETKTTDLAKYELATKLSTSDFIKALSGGRKRKDKQIAASLVQPYVESLEGRLKALEPIYDVVDHFVTTLNEFLADKSVSFKLSKGFKIVNRLGAPLDAAQLSSGEQQLFLLFCYVLIARDHPSVFMIDEPEISLNIRWQRKLIQSLLDVTREARIQFIFASHSMELLAQHRSRVVKLENLK